MKQYLEIGKIVSVFGIKGEVKVEPWCDTPQLLCQFDILYYKSGTPVKIERARVHKNQVLLKIEGVDTPEEGVKLRGRVLYMDRADVELPEGVYFQQDLIGLEVSDSGTGEVPTALSPMYCRPVLMMCTKLRTARRLSAISRRYPR